MGFILHAVGCRSPLFSMISNGCVPLPFQKASGSPFSHNLTHFSRFTSVFTHIFTYRGKMAALPGRLNHYLRVNYVQ